MPLTLMTYPLPVNIKDDCLENMSLLLVLPFYLTAHVMGELRLKYSISHLDLWIRVAGGASLVAQWLRICLLMQGIRVRALVWEDPTCRGATRPVSHDY